MKGTEKTQQIETQRRELSLIYVDGFIKYRIYLNLKKKQKQQQKEQEDKSNLTQHNKKLA